jgi:hypothetical protein
MPLPSLPLRAAGPQVERALICVSLHMTIAKVFDIFVEAKLRDARYVTAPMFIYSIGELDLNPAPGPSSPG